MKLKTILLHAKQKIKNPITFEIVFIHSFIKEFPFSSPANLLFLAVPKVMF